MGSVDDRPDRGIPGWVFEVPWLTVRQPWADLEMSGVKPVENRSWEPYSTLPQWWRCEACDLRKPAAELTGWLHNHDADETPRETGGVHRLVPDGPFPFRLGIHAAAKPFGFGSPEADAVRDLASHDYRTLYGYVGGDPELSSNYPLGALLGSVQVTGCHDADACRIAAGWGVEEMLCSRWAEPDVYHWTLSDPEPLPEPIPWKGRQGLWRIGDEDG
jgi:hypothetical protein